MAEKALDHENLLFPVVTVSLQLSILNHNASIFHFSACSMGKSEGKVFRPLQAKSS